MPRYYFRLTDGNQILNNHKGVDLAGDAAALEDALALARDLNLDRSCRAGIGLAGSSRSSIRKAKRLTKSPSLTFEQQRVYFPNTSCAAASRLAFGFSVQNDTSCSAFVFSTSTSTTVGSSSSV